MRLFINSYPSSNHWGFQFQFYLVFVVELVGYEMHLYMSKELQVLGVEVSRGKFVWAINKLIGFSSKLKLDIDLITHRATV